MELQLYRLRGSKSPDWHSVQHPSSDLASLGHLLPQGEKVKASARHLGVVGEDQPPNSSSICARMISSKLCSATNPSSRARLASKRVGQFWTIAQVAASGTSRMSFTTSAPAMRSSASI